MCTVKVNAVENLQEVFLMLLENKSRIQKIYIKWHIFIYKINASNGNANPKVNPAVLQSSNHLKYQYTYCRKHYYFLQQISKLQITACSKQFFRKNKIQ